MKNEPHFSDFILLPEYFDHSGSLHGIGHTYRVMTLAYELGNRLSLIRERNLAFMAAFIHDMARKHDGFCTRHGKKAVETKLPVFKDLFLSNGATEKDIPEIAFAVHYHCKYFQPSRKHPYFLTLAILKDADALDRIRLGENNLDPRFLRFPESHHMIDYARDLYRRSGENLTMLEMLRI